MKKLCVVFMGMVALFALAPGVSVQAFLASHGTSRITDFPILGSSAGWVSRGAPCGGRSSTLSMYFGWLEHPKGSAWSLQRQASTGTAPWPLKGFWLGASDEVTLNNGFGLIVSGSAFFPQRGAGTWYTEPSTRTFDFEIPSYDWWSVDGLAKARVYGGLEILGGLRWDHTSIRVNYSDTTNDDYILNTYVPLMGVQLHRPLPNYSLLIRFVGSPLVAGRLRYHYWTNRAYSAFGNFDVNSGSFMEFFANYSIRMRGNLSLGGFAKWNALHVKTAERRLSGSVTEPVSWSVTIQWWTVGGTLSLGFFSPF